MRRQAIAFALGLAACGSLPGQPDTPSDPPWRTERDGGDAGDGGSAAEAAFSPTDAVVVPVTIVRTFQEPWGPNCPRGGVRIESGVDLDGNRVIDSADQSLGDQYVCNVYPVSVSLGAQHGCALASNGSVWCWGADDAGQLGDYGEYAAYAPRPVGGVEKATALAVGDDFGCVILPTTGVRCWGKTDRGQGGHGSVRPFITPSCVNLPGGAALLGATSLAAGSAHACAVLDSGSLFCWGANDVGQLADGSTVDRSAPVEVPAIADARSVVAGGRHACVLLGDTTVRCWGANDEGQLGDGTTTARSVPVAVLTADGAAPLAGVTALAAGDAFTCALTDDGGTLCWGANSHCQLGLPPTVVRAPLPAAAPVRDVRSLAAGSRHSCAVLGAGRAACWGDNGFGQLGAPVGDCRAVPVALPLPHVVSVGAGRDHSCAIDEVGLWCWGDNSSGQLGVGMPTAPSSEPRLARWDLAP